MKKNNGNRSDLIVKLGKTIAQIRRNRDLTQEELADAVDMMPATVSRIECGVTDTSVSILEKIAKAFNIEVSTLFAEAEVQHIGLPRELEDLINLLKDQKPSVIAAILKQAEITIAVAKK